MMFAYLKRSPMYAIIETGGKQLWVVPGETVKVAGPMTASGAAAEFLQISTYLPSVPSCANAGTAQKAAANTPRSSTTNLRMRCFPLVSKLPKNADADIRAVRG